MTTEYQMYEGNRGLNELRRPRRYPLQLALSVSGLGSGFETFQGVTRNVSSRGVLFISETALPLDSRIQYVITWNQNEPAPVNLRCVGRVLRLKRIDNAWGPSYEVAATLVRHVFLRDLHLPKSSEPDIRDHHEQLAVI